MQPALASHTICLYNERTQSPLESIMSHHATATKLEAARSGRLGLRTLPEQEALLRHAAQVSRKSMTEFVLDSACAAAEQTLLDQRYFLVDDSQWEAFNAALDGTAKDIPELRKLFENKSPWE
jgi:uncharacterized protein (DUF1778 family)